MIYMIKSIWAPDKQVKIFSNSVSISPWYLINSDLGVEKTKYLQKLSGWNDTAESETPVNLTTRSKCTSRSQNRKLPGCS